uniref:Uncharacterized protein n=1 Tax=Oryza barthii TaxID=65489 RepID=A0A0D3HJ65_9ORYZ
MALPVTTRDCSPVLSGEEQVISSSSSPEPPLVLPQAPSGSGSGGVESGDMGDENEQLRREDVQLARELSQMRKLYNNILPPHVQVLRHRATAWSTILRATCPRLLGT